MKLSICRQRVEGRNITEITIPSIPAHRAFVSPGHWRTLGPARKLVSSEESHQWTNSPLIFKWQ